MLCLSHARKAGEVLTMVASVLSKVVGELCKGCVCFVVAKDAEGVAKVS